MTDLILTVTIADFFCSVVSTTVHSTMVTASTLYNGRALPDEIRLAIGNNADRQTLCSLSLVSKAWMAVTNELVWRSLPSLSPLLGLFPDDSREIHSGSVATVVRVICRQ